MEITKLLSLQCLQINLQKSRSAVSNLVDFCTHKNIDIAFVQEPYNLHNKPAGIPSNVSIYCVGENRKRSAILVFNKCIDVMLISHVSDEDNVLLEIKTGDNFTFYAASMYFDKQIDILDNIKKLEGFMGMIGNSPFLMGIDSNARSVSWFDRVRDSRGKLLEEWLSSNSMFVLNNDISRPTFETSRAESNIDLTIANYIMLPYVDKWTMSEEESCSDHNFITFIIHLNNKKTYDNNFYKSIYKYNTLKADWQKFHLVLFNCVHRFFKVDNSLTSIDFNYLDKFIASVIRSTANLNLFMVQFMEIVKLTCDKTIPKSTITACKRGHGSVPWWNNELTELRRTVNSLRRKFQRTKNDAILRDTRKKEYYATKIKYKDLIKTAKAKSWKKFCNATNKSQPWNYIYKAAAGKLKTQTLFTSIQRQDGSYTCTLEETLNVLLEKYVPLDNVDSDNANNYLVRQKSLEYYESGLNDIPFSQYEVKSIMDSFDVKKAPGEDGITPDIINKIFTKMPLSIVALYNECLSRGIFPDLWKKSIILSIIKPGKENCDTVDKFRPISLLSVWGKILEKLLINRIMHYLNSKDLLSIRQFGFTPQKSTLDAIMEVSGYIEDALVSKEIVLLISLDVKGAFDAAWWPAILVQLQEFNCPSNLYRMAKDYFMNREAVIRTNTLHLKRKLTKGCPQGSCCGPGFWILQYDSLLKKKFPVGSLVIAFADDLLIAVRGKTVLETECIGNACIRLVEQWSQDNKIVFNISKSHGLLISRKLAEATLSVFLNNKPLQIVKELKYLGIIFDSKFSWNNHISYVTNKSLQLVTMLSRSAKVYWGVGSDALQVIYDGALIPLLTYALPAWYKSLNRTYNVYKFRRVQRLFLLRLIKGFRTISYEACCIIANVLPIELKFKEIFKKYRIMKGYEGGSAIKIDLPIKPSLWIHPALVPEINMLEYFDSRNFDNTVIIYTDGSRTDNRVGSAFVIYLNGAEVAAGKSRLGETCSNNQAELVAISNSLECLLNSELLINTCGNCVSETVVLRTDSQVSLYCISNRKNHSLCVEKIRRTLIDLQHRKIQVLFNKVKAHAGELGNERADTLAKEASEDCNVEVAFSCAPTTFVDFHLKEESLHLWEQQWLESEKGAQTKEFFLTVQDRREADFKLSYKLTQVLSGHGRTKVYLHRFNILPDPMCRCDFSSRQTWHHILFDCRLFERERAFFMRDVITKGFTWPPPKNIIIKSELCSVFLCYLFRLDFDRFLD